MIRDTRAPVHDIAAGHALDRILKAWPSLDAETVRLSAIYAEANPLGARPHVPGDLPKGATIITDRRVPRKRTLEGG